MQVVRSRFRVLIAEQEIREGRSISLRGLNENLGVPMSTLTGLANNTIKRVPLDELATLCRYFSCDVGDILRMEEVSF